MRPGNLQRGVIQWACHTVHSAHRAEQLDIFQVQQLIFCCWSQKYAVG